MKFDFSSLPLRNRAFSEQPMAFLDLEPRTMLSAMMEMALIETGNPAARGYWQKSQLRHLLDHASRRSAFWKKRVGNKKSSDIDLGSLPVLTREDLRKQVASEGSLLRPADGIPTATGATSGSTGVPVRFFFSEINGRYNSARSMAQYLIEGRDLSRNRTRLIADYSRKTPGFSVKKSASWLGEMAALIKAGELKTIEYFNPDPEELFDEMRKDDVGYLVCAPFVLETLLHECGPEILKTAKIEMCIPLGEHVGEEVLKAFSDHQIPVRSTYSSEEVGPIGFECGSCPGHFHVASTNVIVEIVDQTYQVGGLRLGRVLVTNLHSYATPFIRYELGDLACLREKCPCGHDGPTIDHLHGRLSSVIKHRDGRISPFSILGRTMAKRAKFKDYRIRQTEFEKIVVEIGGRSDLSVDETAALTDLMRGQVGPEFEIEIKPCETIEWGDSRKRLGFRCEV